MLLVSALCITGVLIGLFPYREWLRTQVASFLTRDAFRL